MVSWPEGILHEDSQHHETKKQEHWEMILISSEAERSFVIEIWSFLSRMF